MCSQVPHPHPLPPPLLARPFTLQYDSNANALRGWLDPNPWLATMTTNDSSARTAAQLASIECWEIIANRIYFMGQFDPASGPPEHKSVTSVVS